jgi:hypothetical protein
MMVTHEGDAWCWHGVQINQGRMPECLDAQPSLFLVLRRSKSRPQSQVHVLGRAFEQPLTSAATQGSACMWPPSFALRYGMKS